MKYVNRKLYREFGSRAAGNRPYPKLLGYIFSVYFLALHRHYPHLVYQIRKIIEENIRGKRTRRKFEEYVSFFLSRGSPILLQQYA